MRHIDSCVDCLSAIDNADGLCACLVDSLFYWAQSLCPRSLGPFLPACRPTGSQHCESYGAPEVGGGRVRNTPQPASPKRRIVRVALDVLGILHFSERCFVSRYRGEACVFRVSVGPLGWFDSAFVVGSETAFIRVLAIVLANTFICAVCFFPLTIAFQAVFRRSHITELGISRSEKDQAEDEDET